MLYLNIKKESRWYYGIKKVKLFPNNNKHSLAVSKLLRNKLVKNGYQVVENDYDLAIAIGGDGSFLRMVKENNFNDNIYYIGVNTGTLGFLQEIQPAEIDLFLDKIKNELYKIERVGIQETNIISEKEEKTVYSLNEIAIRDESFNVVKLNVYVNNSLLGLYTGDGLLVATSIGSTAYNVSLNGSIVYGDLHTLQVTPIAPLKNKEYRNLENSIVIPEKKIIKIVPLDVNRNLMMLVDGEKLELSRVEEIKTSVSKKKINCLRMNDYDYTNIIHDKLLK